jgi:hypothetical protein
MTRLADLAEPPVPTEEDDAEPVTRGEVRMLRRWVVVAAVWAVAATVVALVALLDDSGRAAERRSNETGRRVALSEARVDARLDRVESRLRLLPSSAEVEGLRQQADQARRAAAGDRTDLTALEKRVSALENSSSGGGSGDGGGSGGGLPSLRDLFP